MRIVLIWGLLAVALGAPVIAAGFSPLLQWRDPIYIMAGFAGVLGMAVMLIQPLLAAALLPGLALHTTRRLHRLLGAGLVLAVGAHVIGLWITSPPDVIDVLLFRSPTPFAIWGALAMWAVFAAAGLVLIRARLPLRLWRRAHTLMVGLAVVGTVVHALQIEGTMEAVTKVILSICAIATLFVAVVHRRVWARGTRTGR